VAEIVIIVQPSGQSSVEAVGYQGPSCSLATRPYVKALGVKDGELPKGEMWQGRVLGLAGTDLGTP
jgi:hypothetical protein